ncbi:GSCFA domain-containing protein [Pseudooceanicola marinus]|uniref:GSCFA domain-containing protein n=1 Tax=Pseudooceanicola marinus TaxID=396013 RepID=UPI001CD4B8DB|nr:GSCFA domain-containing protein [Pseudooceanicola marinus]MCA1336737.1 GSCFA domain-containing protein [Pseudooceanicola marinus]
MAPDGEGVVARALRNPARRYPDRSDARSAGGMLRPQITPSFHLAPNGGVFTIGSCFARNVEDALIAAGLEVPTTAFSAPLEEAPGRPNRLLNQYNPATMLQCLRDAETGETGAGLYRLPTAAGADQGEAGQAAAEDQEMVQDCLLATGGRAVARARALERRAQIRRLYAEGLASCDTVVVTLGLVECWFDQFEGIYLNEVPNRRLLRAEPERFVFRRLDTATCRDMLFEMMDRLVTEGGQRVLLTLSPVPLQATFVEGDAIMRNAYSKAVLRVVAEEVAEQFDGVDYFPSYEMVTSMGLAAFDNDNVHVRPAVVSEVIAHMTAHYLRGSMEGAA